MFSRTLLFKSLKLVCATSLVLAWSCVVAVAQDVSYEGHGPLDVNNWTYIPTDNDNPRYDDVSILGDIQYDKYGRISSFKAKDSDGKVLFIETLTYRDGKVYNALGQLVMTTVSLRGMDIAKAEKAAKKEATRTAVRSVVTGIKDRTSSVLVPRQNAAGNTDKVSSLKKRMKSELVGMNVAQGTPAPRGLAYSVERQRELIGLAAGDDEDGLDTLGIGVWTSASCNLFGNYKNSEQYDGVSYLALAGVDYLVNERMVIGVGFGLEGASLETQFYGVNDQEGNTGVSFSPYVSIELFENLLFDLVTGVAFLEYGSSAYSYNSGTRFMVSPGVTQYFFWGDWKVSGGLGFTYAHEEASAYRKNNDLGLFTLPDYSGPKIQGKPDPIEFGEARIGTRVGYMFAIAEPYLAVNYLYDILEYESDPDEVEGVLGCDFYPTQSFILGFELGNSFFRENVYNMRMMMNMRYEF